MSFQVNAYELAELFGDLAETGDRRPAAERLAVALGATGAYVFVRDDELGVYLPALGFPQTLPGAAAWRRLVEEAVRSTTAAGTVPSPDGVSTDALAVAADSVLVLTGTCDIADPMALRPFLKILGGVLRQERKLLAVEGKLAIAIDTTKEVHSLAAQLEQVRKDLERRVHERTAELKASNRELEAFTYSVSHDLRTPLRAIVATARILIEDFGPTLPDAAKALLERQAERANALGRLIDDLLQMSRVARTELKRAWINLSELADHVAQSVIAGKDTKARIVIAPNLCAYCDQQLIRLVIQNLLDNAVKFSPAGGVITFGKTNEAFFVSDQGIGFDPRFASKIFQPFERLPNDLDIEGTGIGLATVKRIVERHGGTVWAEGLPGEGTTIYFTISPAPID